MDKSKMWRHMERDKNILCRWCGKDKETFDHAKICTGMKADTRFDRWDWEKKLTRPVDRIDRDILEVIDRMDRGPIDKTDDGEKKKKIT